MKKAFFSLLGLAGLLALSSGCQLQHTPHLYNPMHWEAHLAQVFSPKDGSLHQLHMDLDLVIFGLDHWEDSEPEYVYSE